MSNEDEAVKWLRTQVEARRALARHAIESEAAAAEWHEMTSGVLVTGPAAVDDAWDGVHPIGDSRITRLMEANDPQDTIARCEAELGILDLYEEQAAKAGGNAMEEDRAWTLGRAVRLLASGYRHRPGYGEAWEA